MRLFSLSLFSLALISPRNSFQYSGRRSFQTSLIVSKAMSTEQLSTGEVQIDEQAHPRWEGKNYNISIKPEFSNVVETLVIRNVAKWDCSWPIL